MLDEFIQQSTSWMINFHYLLMAVNALVNIFFAGAVARDSGKFYKLGQRPALVSGPTWAFATLVGGVVSAAIYWFIHYSTLTRTTARDNYDRT